MIPVIEIFGLPGSGKTYFAEKLLEFLRHDSRYHFLTRDQISLRALKLRDDGLPTNLVKKLPSPLWHPVFHEDYCLQELLSFASKHINLFQFAFAVLGTAGISIKHTRSILGALARTSVEYELSSSMSHTPDEILLADEWFCHRLYTIFGNCALTASDQQLLDYVQFIPVSRVTVFVATPPEECIRRMAMRNRFPVLLEQQPPSERERRLNAAYELLQDFSGKMAEQGRKIVMYDGFSNDYERFADICLHSLGEVQA